MAARAIRPHLFLPERGYVLCYSPAALQQCSLSFKTKSQTPKLMTKAYSTSVTPDAAVKLPEKPLVCTADELHYVTVQNSSWRLALWRYLPSPGAPARNHPLLLLSGVGTNAIGYDLSPECSFARHMSNNGYNTWILEVRGAGLSVEASRDEDIQLSAKALSDEMEAVAGIAVDRKSAMEERSTNNLPSPLTAELDVSRDITTVWDESKLVSRLTETLMRFSESLSGFLSDAQLKTMSSVLLDQISNLLEDTQLSESLNEVRVKLVNLLVERQNSSIAVQIRNLSERLVNIIEEGQKSVSPPLYDIQERLVSSIEEIQRQLDLIMKYDWDLDNFLEEDIPAVMDYIKSQSKPKDGKLLAIGHSMGGILLYSMLSRNGHDGTEPPFSAIVTLASSLDYSSSNSSFKSLTPIADSAQVLNVPVIPLGTFMAATYPLACRPPYVFPWLKYFITAEDMMHPAMLEKLVMNNFCTVPVKLLLQLRTALNEGGLQDRSGSFFYKNHLHKTSVPILAVAGDQDVICPPEAVEATVRVLPKHHVTYKLFGEPGGPHYAHYDLVGSKLAVKEIYPCVVEFLNQHD